MRRALALALAIAAAGCGVDPCAGKSGACLALHVDGDGVSTIDQLELAFSGAISDDVRTPAAPGAPVDLPIAVALILPAGRGGSLLLHATGFLAGQALGQGDAQTTLQPDAGGSLSLTLHAGGGNPDLAGGDAARPDLAMPVDFAGDDLAGIDFSTPPDLAGLTLAKLTPAVGPTSGGATITATGTQFQAGATVTVGGKPATNVTVTAPDTLTFTLPAHPGAFGLTAVTVQNPSGASDTRGDLFRYALTSLLFAPPVVTPGPAQSRAVAFADLDGDGKLDAVLGDQAAPPLLLYLGKGDGTFAASTTFPFGGSTHMVMFGDWNGDGLADIATGNQSTPLFTALGDGKAGLLNPLPQGPSPGVDAVAGDFNGDGKIDLAIAVVAGPVYTAIGKGDGTFVVQGPYDTGGSSLFGIAAGDLDRDGHLDVVIADTGTSMGLVMRGKGDGSFGPPDKYPAPGAHDVAMGDLDGDGLPEVLLAATTVNAILVLHDDGTGTGKLVMTQQVPGGTAPFDLSLADLDGDGDLDALSHDSTGPLIHLLLNNGGSLQPGPMLAAPQPSPRDPKAVDLNGDGLPDVGAALQGTAGGVLVFLNQSQ